MFRDILSVTGVDAPQPLCKGSLHPIILKGSLEFMASGRKTNDPGYELPTLSEQGRTREPLSVTMGKLIDDTVAVLMVTGDYAEYRGRLSAELVLYESLKRGEGKGVTDT